MQTSACSELCNITRLLLLVNREYDRYIGSIICNKALHWMRNSLNVMRVMVKRQVTPRSLKVLQLSWVGLGLCCLMTPGLSKDIRCHVLRPYFSKLANHQNRHQATHKWPASLVIAYGHFNFPQGFVWVCMD